MNFKTKLQLFAMSTGLKHIAKDFGDIAKDLASDATEVAKEGAATFKEGFMEGWNEGMEKHGDEIKQNIAEIKQGWRELKESVNSKKQKQQVKTEPVKVSRTKGTGRAYFNDRTLLQKNNVMVIIRDQYDIEIKTKDYLNKDVKIKSIECKQTENYFYIELNVHIKYDNKHKQSKGTYSFNF